MTAVRSPRAEHPAPLGGADVLIALAILVSLFLCLGSAPLFDVDEGAFSEATREMVAHRDWGFTTLNGVPRFDKPILVYWLQAASVSLLGVNEWAFRLPSALCATVWSLAVWAFARPRLGAGAARLSALAVATSLGVLAIGRAATADSLLNMLMCLSMLDLWRYLERPDHDTAAIGALRRTFAWVGLGLLAKGPVAVLIPGAVAVIYIASTGQWIKLRRALLDLPGWAVLLLIAVPWYAYALQRHGMDFVNGFLLKHNVSRYTSSLEGHSGSLLYYAVLGPLLWLPWSGLLPALLARVRMHWAQPLGRFLWIWAVFVLGFFSLSGTKLPHYVLYGSTPVFIGLGAMAASHSGATVSMRASRGLAGMLITVLLIGLPWAPHLMQHMADSCQIADPFYRELASGATRAAPTLWPALSGAALVVWLLVGWRTRRFGTGLALGATLSAALVAGCFTPWLGDVLQGPIKRAAAVAATHPEPGVQWMLHHPSFSVYRQAVTPLAEPHPGELALTRSDRLARTPCADCRVLFAERGVVLIQKAPAP